MLPWLPEMLPWLLETLPLELQSSGMLMSLESLSLLIMLPHETQLPETLPLELQLLGMLPPPESLPPSVISVYFNNNHEYYTPL